jgi:predicted HTH domain antitoxin
MAALRIDIPDSVLVGSGQSVADFEKEAKLLLMTKLYEMGRLSSGNAAEACGFSRPEFLFAAGRLGASLIQLDRDELRDELNAG